MSYTCSKHPQKLKKLIQKIKLKTPLRQSSPQIDPETNPPGKGSTRMRSSTFWLKFWSIRQWNYPIRRNPPLFGSNSDRSAGFWVIQRITDTGVWEIYVIYELMLSWIWSKGVVINKGSVGPEDHLLGPNAFQNQIVGPQHIFRRPPKILLPYGQVIYDQSLSSWGFSKTFVSRQCCAFSFSSC